MNIKVNKTNLTGKRAKIKGDNDNDNYSPYKGKVLIITYYNNCGRGYDDTMYPQNLCDFECEDGTDFPFALYEYEFDLI